MPSTIDLEVGNARRRVQIPYALRRIPPSSFAHLQPYGAEPEVGNVVLASVEKLGRNARLELANGRAATLHEGDLVAAVFGNRYATEQFEGYAQADGNTCHLLSMGGLCGTVVTRHAAVAEPTKLRLLGAFADPSAQPLRLRDFARLPARTNHRPRVLVVCGSSMDAGKTHTAMSVIRGLHRAGQPVAGIKLTGTAAGRDTWSMYDAGACAALDFTDGGYPSTYLCTTGQLIDLHELLLGHAAAEGARWVVIEIADGLFQQETAALLRSSRFGSTIAAWLFATSDPLAAAHGVRTLRQLGVEPVAISGVITQSPLAMQEATTATGVPCLTAAELQAGALNAQLLNAPVRALAPEVPQLVADRIAINAA